MNQQLPPPWMLGSKDIDDIPMLVVHMSNGELEGLDDLQGGPSVDEETGIREYSKLADIIMIPEIRDLFHSIANQVETTGDFSQDVHEAYQTSKEHSLPYRETEEEEHNPLRHLEKMGRGEDSKLAYIPVNLAELLIEIRHVPSINPKTGLLEFFWPLILGGGALLLGATGIGKNVGKMLNKMLGKKASEIIRIAGTIGGALLGGPLGAGVGNALGSAATGKSLQNSVVSGLKNSALAYGIQGAGQAAGFTGATPYTAGFFGGAPNMLATGLGKMGIGNAGATANTTAAAPALNHAQQAQQLINSSFAPQQQGILGTLTNVGSTIAPYAPLAMAGLSYMGEKQHHKHMSKERERQEAKWNREREEMGLNTNWTPVATRQYEENPEFWDITEEDIKHGRIHAPYLRPVGTSGRYAKGGLVQSFNKGTLVRGKGKGQDDKIKTSVPDGTYISDASANSMLGDGSSEAGAKVWQQFEKDIKKRVPKKVLHHVEKLVKKKSQQVPVWLSDSEYKLDPVTVSVIPYALGEKKISNERGADILRAAIKNIRKHKSQAGPGLPPKAKPLLEYMSASRN